MPRDVPDVFLLGAGFARAISRSMPLLPELGPRLLENFHGPTRIPREVSAMMRTNFAHALSYLEQSKPWVTEADNLRHRALFLEFSTAIARHLDDTVAAVAHKVAGAPPDWLVRLIRHWHQQRCTVLTLNYDTLVETIAARVPVENGRGVAAQQLYPPLLTDAAARAGTSAATHRDETFRFLKLHGSTNWYFSGRTSARGEPIYFVPPVAAAQMTPAERQEHAFRLNAVADKYPLLVPPIYDKAALLTHETVRALWFEAGDALKHARRVVCMGYSLPPSDLTMKHFLATACGRRTTFEIVDQSEDAVASFRGLFRGTRVQVRQRADGRAAIAQFVTRLLDS
jgi:hypothetical protein